MAFLSNFKKIKYKVIIIVLIISTIAIMAGQLLGLYYTTKNSHQQLANRAILDSKLIAEYCVAPLTFNDVSGIKDVLSKLKSNPEIVNVFIYDENNNFITSYKKGDSLANYSNHFPISSESSGYIDNYYHVSQLITYEGFNYGTLYLIASTQSLDKAFNDNLKLLFILFVTLLILSIVLAGILQRAISGPIIQLTEKVQEITRAGDYSLRVKKTTKDEIGKLYDNFNNMLEQIQYRKIANAKAEEIIKKERDKAKDYLDIATVTIMAIDREGNILQVNKKGCELLEVKNENDIIGKNWYDLFVPEENRESGKALYKKMIEDAIHDDNTTEERIITLGGNSKLISWKDVFLKDDKGRITGMLGSAEDITEKKARELELSKLSSAIEQSISGIIIMNLNWEIEYVNKSFSNITAYDFEDVQGKRPTFMFENDNEEINEALLIKEITDLIASGKSWHKEFQSRKKSGELYWSSVEVSSILNEEGKIINYVSIYEDITNKKNQDLIIQSSNEKLESVIENSPLGIFHFNGKGELTLVNKSLCKFFKTDRQTLMGYNLLDNLSDEGIISAFKKCLKGDNSEFRGPFYSSLRDKNLFIKAVFTPLAPDENGNFNGFCMAEDISKRIKVEKMQRDRDAAEASNKAKSEFLARMSHEIRTPMNAIIGLSHLALKTDLNNRQLDYITKINNSGQHLLGIINDILDFSKIEAGKLSIENTKFEFEKILTDLSSLITMKAQEKGIEFTFIIDPEVPYNLVGDPLRLNQVLTNLANNAVKFTEKGEVNLRVSVINKTSYNVELKFVVEDTGIGISPGDISNLFQSFSQADVSTSRKYGGTGLGLAISQRLVELMGGKIWAESELGKGSKFIFSAIFGTQSKQKDKPKAVLDGLRVLICDDNQTSLQFFCAVLKIFNIDVKGVTSGFKAIETLEENKGKPFDIVIMDWMMPQMDGITTIEKIKSSTLIDKQPVFIMLTAYGKDKKLHRKVEKLGIEGFAEKPITRSTLYDTIMNSIGSNDKIKQNLKPDIIPTKGLKNILGSRILLAEDNEINSQVATELLESEGFEVESANNGEEALKMVLNSGKPSSYDIVLMDLQMPVMDGYTSTKEIRKYNKFDKLPIVAMTADAMAGVAEKCFEIGMQDFITKPISPEELFNCLVKWIPENQTLAKGIITKRKITDSAKSEQISIDIPEFNNIVIEEGLHRIGGNKTAYIKLLKRFYENNNQFVSKAIKYYHTGDFDQLQRLIHTLKGVSGNIAANVLHKEVVTLEKKMKSDSKPQIETLINKIDEVLTPVLKEIEIKIIEQPVKKIDNKVDLEESKSKIISLINKLEACLKESDAKAIDLAEELGNYAGQIYQYDDLINSINQYDFDDALKQVINIKERLLYE